MLDDLEYDDSDAPTIGLVPDGISWADVRDHIKLAHAPLLVPPASGGDYTGAYWTGTDMVLAAGPGPGPGRGPGRVPRLPPRPGRALTVRATQPIHVTSVSVTVCWASLIT